MVKAIAIGDEAVYLFEMDTEDEMEELLESWYAVYDAYFERCGEIFKLVYRKEFGIPFNATMREEAAFIIDNYGSPPALNSNYVDRLLAVQIEYGNLIGTAPGFAEFAFEHGIKLEMVPTIVDI